MEQAQKKYEVFTRVHCPKCGKRRQHYVHRCLVCGAFNPKQIKIPFIQKIKDKFPFLK